MGSKQQEEQKQSQVNLFEVSLPLLPQTVSLT